MLNRLLSLIVVLASVLGTACGGGNPNKPELTCKDETASNYGGPLPCVPRPVVVVNNVTFVDSTPKPGSTLLKTVLSGGTEGSPVSGDQLEVSLKHEISAQDVAEAQKSGRDIAVRTYLSVDGVNVVPTEASYRIWVPAGVQVGEGKHKFHVVAVKSPTITKTEFIIVHFEFVTKSNAREVFFKKAVPATYFWSTPK